MSDGRAAFRVFDGGRPDGEEIQPPELADDQPTLFPLD
jgi:hypothetical protein